MSEIDIDRFKMSHVLGMGMCHFVAETRIYIYIRIDAVFCFVNREILGNSIFLGRHVYKIGHNNAKFAQPSVTKFLIIIAVGSLCIVKVS